MGKDDLENIGRNMSYKRMSTRVLDKKWLHLLKKLTLMKN